MVAKVSGKNPFWMAFHDIESNINGASWYKSVWSSHTFECVDLYDHLLDVIPCSTGSSQSWFIQIGAHLGIFPQQGASRGCAAISLEGSRLHIPLIRHTALLNNHQQNHHVIHAAAGEKPSELFFGKDAIFSTYADIPAHELPAVERVRVVTIDEIMSNYTAARDVVNVMIIDVEGYENEVLLGGQHTIRSQRVQFFNIEVWIRKNGKDVKSFPGLELLVQSGYLLFIGRNHPIKNKLKYKIPKKPITTKMLLTNQHLRQRICKCSNTSVLSDNCLFDLHVLHPDLNKHEIFYW